ncbi:MAG: DUF3606 domain-containing protein [Bacteroidota bacterium]
MTKVTAKTRNAVNRDKTAAQEEWIIEFLKNKFQVSYQKLKEAIKCVGNSPSAIQNYLSKKNRC